MTITTLTPTSFRTEFHDSVSGDWTSFGGIECGYGLLGGGSEFGGQAVGFAVFDTSALDGQSITKVELYRHFDYGTEGDLGASRTLTHKVEGAACYSQVGSTFTNNQWIEFTSAAYTAINKTGNSEVSFECSSAVLLQLTLYSSPQLRITHEDEPEPIVISGTFNIQIMVGT